MSNFFQFITYILFGKRWLLWDMKQGYKGTLFVNEIEIEMTKEKMARAQKEADDTRKEIEELTNAPLKDAMDVLPVELREDKKAVAEMIGKIRTEREEALKGLANKLKTAEQTVQLSDGELSRIYGITYNNRLKYDFIKNYKIKKTYADLDIE